MPGRVSNAGSYRYGFNGKEIDSNNLRTRGMSMIMDLGIYDPRLEGSA